MNKAIALIRSEIKISKIVWVFGFALLTALCAHLRLPLPFTPVPITLQTFAVMLAGAMLGARAGFASQALYVGLGALGLPLFAGKSIIGPTGGYLIGFILAAYVIGKLIGDKKAGAFEVTLAMLCGEIILFTFGTLWLKFFLNISILQALALGILPFIPGEFVKVFAAAATFIHLPKLDK